MIQQKIKRNKNQPQWGWFFKSKLNWFRDLSLRQPYQRLLKPRQLFRWPLI